MFLPPLQRYVDLYTSRVTNFLQYPGDFRFYPEVKLLPHQQPSSSVFVEEAHEIA